MLKISLAAARVNAEMTQGEVAEKMGISRQTVLNWEHGRTVPTVSDLTMLSNLYGISIDDIFLPCDSTNSRLDTA